MKKKEREREKNELRSDYKKICCSINQSDANFIPDKSKKKN